MFRNRLRNKRRTIVVALVVAVASATAAAQDTPGDVDKEFAIVKTQFATNADSSFGTDVNSWAVTGGYVTKRFLKASISTAIRDAGLSVSVSLPGVPFTAPYTEVTTETIDPIPCNADRGCNSDCDFWDVGCHLAKLDCERLKAMEKGACELKKAAQQSISHKKLLTLFLYDIDTGAADTIHVSANGQATILGLTFSDDLSKAELATNIQVAALVSAKARVKFEGAIKVALVACTLNPGCFVDQDIFIKDQTVKVDHPDLRLPISLSAPTVADDHIKMDVTFEKTTITLRFDKSPIVRLLESDARNLTTLLLCPIPVTALSAVEEFFPNDFMKKDQDLPAITKTQEIASIHAPVLGHTYKLTPVVNDKAWGVTAQLETK
jgi:hypothetical protein